MNLADYKVIKQFLSENNVTDSEMDMMWNAMYSINPLVKQLTDCGKHWSDLNRGCQLDLIKRYNASIKEG